MCPVVLSYFPSSMPLIFYIFLILYLSTCAVSHPYFLNPSLFALFSNILLGWSVDPWRHVLSHWGRHAAGMDPEPRFGGRSRYYQHRLHRRTGAFTSCSFHHKSIHYTQPVCNTHSNTISVAPNRMLPYQPCACYLIKRAYIAWLTIRMLPDQTCLLGRPVTQRQRAVQARSNGLHPDGKQPGMGVAVVG